MDAGSLVLAALVLLIALGLLVWTCIAMAQVDEEMREVCGFEFLPFAIASRDGTRGP